MNEENLKLCESFLPTTYAKQGGESLRSQQNLIKDLLCQRNIPADGWDDETVKLLLRDLSFMDSNNFKANVGAGEREGRVYSKIVQDRHFGLSHGIGRSGDIAAIQPKAAGSSLIVSLSRCLVLSWLKLSGATLTKSAFVFPMATGMSMTMCLLTLKAKRPKGKYVLWPRIDQKSCLKAIYTSGFIPIVIENIFEKDGLRTDLDTLKSKMLELTDEVVCVMSTTSCFAPRGPDKISEISELCKEFNIPHLVNNAYGVQSSKCMHLINEGMRKGRIDLFVQSTDKNLMVPVGGAVIASDDKYTTVEEVCKNYPGRASGTPTLDVFLTLLSMGQKNYLQLLKDRKMVFAYLKEKLTIWAQDHQEYLLETPNNQISIAISLSGFSSLKLDDLTLFGSMLFSRGVSGTRVLSPLAEKSINDLHFIGYGSHSSEYKTPYFTSAAAVGMTISDVDIYIDRLTKTMATFKGKMKNKLN